VCVCVCMGMGKQYNILYPNVAGDAPPIFFQFFFNRLARDEPPSVPTAGRDSASSSP